MKKVIFHPEATAEMFEAANFYEDQHHNLGRRFARAVEEAVARVRANPVLYPLVEADVRRCLVKTFPFSILFRLKRNKVLIMAVMHTSRKPGYWKDGRLDNTVKK
jgi:plasmid stabilization system protein ParE